MQRVRAAELLTLFQGYQVSNAQGPAKGKQKKYAAFTNAFVRRLSAIDGDELVEFAPTSDRRPIHRYIRVSTGEILAEMPS